MQTGTVLQQSFFSLNVQGEICATYPFSMLLIDFVRLHQDR